MTLRATTQRFLGYFVLLAVTVIWAPLGNYASYLALAAAIVSLLLGVSGAAVLSLIRQAWMQAFFAAFLLIAISIAASSRQLVDLTFVGDFLILPLGLVLALALTHVERGFNVRHLALLCLLGAGAATVTGLVDVFLLGQDRAHGIENSPIHFADIATTLGFLALAGTLDRTTRWTSVFYLGPLLGLAATFLASTRGAIVVAAVLAALFSIVFVLNRRGPIVKRVSLLAGGLLLLLTVPIVAYVFGFTRPLQVVIPVWEILTGRTPSDPSSMYRLEMYRGGLRAFVDAPLFGHGWHNQVTSALPYMGEVALQAYPSEAWSYLHNEPLGFLVGMGLFGLLAYLFLMSAPLLALRSSPHDSQTAARRYMAFCLCSGLFASGMTDVLFMTEQSKILLVTLTAAIGMLCRDKPTFTAESGSE